MLLPVGQSEIDQKDLDCLFFVAMIKRYRVPHRMLSACYARATDYPTGAVEGITT
jgi:hypothetical protein